jgi:hypothetical protein
VTKQRGCSIAESDGSIASATAYRRITATFPGDAPVTFHLWISCKPFSLTGMFPHFGKVANVFARGSPARGG